MAAVARKKLAHPGVPQPWPRGLLGRVRNLVAASGIVPAAYGAVGWGLLTGNRRRGVNFFTAFPQLLLAINGVKPT